MQNNPGFEFSAKATKKASEAVKETALKSVLDIDSYNHKYTQQITKKSNLAVDGESTLGFDKKWTFVKKVSSNPNMDFIEEPKGSFFDEKGEEMASQG